MENSAEGSVAKLGKEVRETAAALTYKTSGVPWPWSTTDGEWVYDLYLSLPEDGNRYEVIEGRLSVSLSPLEIHQRVLRNLLYELEAWVRETKSGRIYPAPFDVILSFAQGKQNYLQPDLLFVAQDRLSIITQQNIQGPPDLVVEILSPSSARHDWKDKKEVYQNYGVAHYWVVDPAAQVITAFRLAAGKYELAGCYEGEAVFAPDGFLDLEIDLAEVWG